MKGVAPSDGKMKLGWDGRGKVKSFYVMHFVIFVKKVGKMLKEKNLKKTFYVEKKRVKNYVTLYISIFFFWFKNRLISV